MINNKEILFPLPDWSQKQRDLHQPNRGSRPEGDHLDYRQQQQQHQELRPICCRNLRQEPDGPWPKVKYRESQRISSHQSQHLQQLSSLLVRQRQQGHHDLDHRHSGVLVLCPHHPLRGHLLQEEMVYQEQAWRLPCRQYLRRLPLPLAELQRPYPKIGWP